MNAPTTAIPLKQFRSHKIVGAARVLEILDDDKLDLGEHGIVTVGADWIEKRGAMPGGYYVAYEDGYTSWSPAAAFENGHTPVLPAPHQDSPVAIMAGAIAEARKMLEHPERAYTERTLRSIVAGLKAILDVDPAYTKAVIQGEPVFTLRGQDIHAGSVVRDWASRVRMSGGLESKVEGAIEIAEEMEAWPVKKNPD